VSAANPTLASLGDFGSEAIAQLDSRSIAQPESAFAGIDPLRALCVGTDVGAQETLTHALTNLELVFAEDAYQALSRINAGPFKLYVIEYWLPNWSGLSLCREIRKEDPHVPICVVSASARSDIDARARRAGANAFLAKPVDERLLDAYVGTLLETAGRRNMSARDAALRAMREEVARRRAALGEQVFSNEFESALKRVACRKAREACREAGGTIAAFERSCAFLWAQTTETER